MLDRTHGAGARTAVTSADEDHVGLSLGDARGDGAHARLADQLDVDAGGAVGVFKVEDQLGQVLD